MATLKNSMVSNAFGDGNEQILTLDNGDRYRIKNSMVPNAFGGGNEKIIEKEYTANTSYSDSKPPSAGRIIRAILLVLLGTACSIGLGYLLEMLVMP